MKVNHDKFGTIEEPRESRTLPAEAAADFHDGAIAIPYVFSAVP